MEKGLAFWIVFLVCLIVCVINVVRTKSYDVGSICLWILVFLLGWAEFGFIVK